MPRHSGTNPPHRRAAHEPPLIWNDLSNCDAAALSFDSWFDSPRHLRDGGGGSGRAKLDDQINLIFADRAEPAVMVVIRRELPRTTGASQAPGLSHRGGRGFSFIARPGQLPSPC